MFYQRQPIKNKLYISKENGNVYFMEEDVLMACPVSSNGIIYLEESCEVEENRRFEDIKKALKE